MEAIFDQFSHYSYNIIIINREETMDKLDPNCDRLPF